MKCKGAALSLLGRQDHFLIGQSPPPQSQVGRKKVGNPPGSGQDFRRAKADDEFFSIGNPCREGTYT